MTTTPFDQIPRECFNLALQRAVASTRCNLANTRWRLGPNEPFRLIALRCPTPGSVPAWTGPDSLTEFQAAVEAWANGLLLGVHYDGDENYVSPTAGIPLRTIAALMWKSSSMYGAMHRSASSWACVSLNLNVIE